MSRFFQYSIWSVMALICLCLGGCDSLNSRSPQKPVTLPPELSIEEHALKGMPTSDESMAFVPVEGTQEEILGKHQDERNRLLPDTSHFENFHLVFSTVVNGQQIVATEYETPSVTTEKGTFYKSYIQVSQGEKVLNTIQTGDSSTINSLQGLWTYDNHWVLEVVNANQKKGSFQNQNEVDFNLSGEIFLDGISLNQQKEYQESFSFQLMDGKPFYFFKKGGQIGISYNGEDFPLGYSQILHYGCCSGSALNPKRAENMVSFFAQHGEKWYFIDIGVYKEK